MKKKLVLLMVWSCSAALWLLPFRAQADFVIEFVDGRKVTVGHYFEEGAMIKIYTPQGSIGFSKAEVKRIFSADANEVGIPLETVSLHRPAETESSASPTLPGEKNATDEKSSATGKTGEKPAGKEETVDREELDAQYHDVAQELQTTWEKHLDDINHEASPEVLEENRRKMNELNLKRHDLIKTARQGEEKNLPEWAQ
jgi:hypothetical protein